MNAKPADDLRPDVKRDWEWAGQHEPKALTFVRNHLYESIKLNDSSDDDDKLRSTDYVVTAPGNISVAVRVRRISNVKFRRDFTIRVERGSGAKTEHVKIIEGHARLYLYCWVNDLSGGTLDEYMIVDLDQLRKTGLLLKPDGENWTSENSQYRRSKFYYWRGETLNEAGCIMEWRRNPLAPVSFKIVTNYMGSIT